MSRGSQNKFPLPLTLPKRPPLLAGFFIPSWPGGTPPGPLMTRTPAVSALLLRSSPSSPA